MKVDDIVLFYEARFGVAVENRKVVVGHVVDMIHVGSDDAEWFEVAYEGKDSTLLAGIFEDEAISCLGPDTIDELVML